MISRFASELARRSMIAVLLSGLLLTTVISQDVHTMRLCPRIHCLWLKESTTKP